MLLKCKLYQSPKFFITCIWNLRNNEKMFENQNVSQIPESDSIC